MSGPAAVGALLALAATAAGVAVLRRAWRRPARGPALLLGWGLLLSAAPLWALESGWDKAVALALLAPSPVAFAVLAGGAEIRRRPSRTKRAATELPDRSGEAVWGGVVRTLYGGPLAGTAALLLGAGWVLRGMGSLPERDAMGLFLVPILWAGGLVWAMTDPRLSRIGAGLAALAAAGGLAAWL